MSNDPPVHAPLDYASPGARVPPRPLGRGTRYFIILLCVLGVLPFAAYFSVPTDYVAHDSQGIVTQASFLRPGIYDWLPVLPLVGAVALLTAGIVLLGHQRSRLGVACILGSVYFVLIPFMLGPLTLRADWVVLSRVSATGGPEYFLIAERGVPSQMAVARLAWTGWV